MLVSDIMNKNPVSVSPEESVALAAKLLSRHNVGSLPVCTEDGKLKGVITDRDIVLRCVAAGNDVKMTKIKDVMSGSVITVSPGDDVSRASRLMSTGQVRRLPVVSSGHLVGMVSLGDMACRPACDMEAARALSDISLNISRK